MDKITIITVTYNCVDDIEVSILSVLEQDYPNIEYIVIDGASTDGTIDIIKKYSNRITYWISEPDNGLYYAMNKGIDKATGDWIYIHNAGGVFPEKNTLSKLFSNDFHDYDAVFGYIYSKTSKSFFRNPTPFYESQKKLKTPGYSHQALFIRSEWAKRFMFDTSFKCCADFNQAMLMYKNGAKFRYVDQDVCHPAPVGFSARNRKTQLLETAKINGVENSLWFKFKLVLYILKTYIRKIF